MSYLVLWAPHLLQISRYWESPSMSIRVRETSTPWGSNMCDLMGSSLCLRQQWIKNFRTLSRRVTLGSETNSRLSEFLVVSDDMALFMTPVKLNSGSYPQAVIQVTVWVWVQVKSDGLGLIRINATYCRCLKQDRRIIDYRSKCCPSSLPKSQGG